MTFSLTYWRDVTASNVLGDEGAGVYILMSGLDVERVLGAAGPLG